MKIDIDFAVASFKSLSIGEVFIYKDEDSMETFMKIHPCEGCVNNTTCNANSINLQDGILYYIDEDDPVYPMGAKLILQSKKL